MLAILSSQKEVSRLSSGTDIGGPNDSGVMPRGQRCGPQFLRLSEEKAEFDAVVAVNAGVGSAAPQVLLDKAADDLFFKSLFQVYHIVRDVQLIRHPAGVPDIIGGTAAARRGSVRPRADPRGAWSGRSPRTPAPARGPRPRSCLRRRSWRQRRVFSLPGR